MLALGDSVVDMVIQALRHQIFVKLAVNLHLRRLQQVVVVEVQTR